ncbi:MAG: glycosyltransferase family 4 protein [Clostridia bacterium]|nr:glycosyltransferase family 4 protein [Clostridia bacterium]
MNIVINAVLAFEQPRGVGRYINNLLPAIAQIDKDNQYYVYFGKWMKNYEFLKIHQSNFHFIELNIKNSMLSRNWYLAVNLPLDCKKYNPDLLFMVDTQAIIVKPCKIVSTIHDLAEFVVPEKYSRKQANIRRMIVRHQVKLSDQIITVSEYSKQDICKRFSLPSDKVKVIYNSVETPEVTELKKPEKYFLYVSEIERAKNLASLIRAYALLPENIKEEYKLYVVGKKGNDYDNVMALCKKNNIVSRVKFFGFVSDKELSDLYASAYCFVFPSVFEGFGLPVLEAMAKGTPVLCSDSSSIPEVGGDAVLTFSPYKENEIVEQLLKLINTVHLRDEMISKGIVRAKCFNKINAAEETVEVFNKIK